MSVKAVHEQPEDNLIAVEHVACNDEYIAVLTLNRPEALNPLDSETVKQLRVTLTALVANEDFRAIILTGAGRAFSAGGDLKGYRNLFQNRERFETYLTDFAEVCHLLERSRVLTFAMVNGTCVAGGLELALACDIITIADDARIGDGHLRFAQLPGAGGSQRLVRAIGAQRARHWLLSGDLFPAESAVEAGLAVATVPRDKLRDFTLDLATRCCRGSAMAIHRMKDLIAVALTEPFDKGLEIERTIAATYATTSNDARKGLDAFAAGRIPNFQRD